MQVNIEDTLPGRVEDACNALKDLLIKWVTDNQDINEVPCLHNDLDHDSCFHEIVDGAVPIYTSEIKDAWYLHGGDLEEAYENAGVGNNPRENDGMTAIYFYIEQKCHKWYENNAKDIISEFTISPDDLPGDTLSDIVVDIRDILFPGGDWDNEWSQDEVEEVANVLRAHRIAPNPVDY